MIRQWTSALRPARLAAGLVLAFALQALAGPPAAAQGQHNLEAVVGVTATVPYGARTADSLGTERQGTGVVIDDSGLVLTIGYLILEAIEVAVVPADGTPVPARIVAYDHESGFGLVRASRPLDVAPVALGETADMRPLEPLLVVSKAPSLDAKGVYLVDRRTYAGYWEYMLEEALFTSPPHGEFGGAALLNAKGELVGIGSLFVGDAGIRGARRLPGNMFVPIDELTPILGDLLAEGHRADPPRPWLGLYLEEHRGRVFVTRVAPGGPGEAAGMQADDLILGIAGQPVGGLADFYRQLWQHGTAGVEVPLDLAKGAAVEPQRIKSGDRYRYLKLNPSY